VEKNIKRLVLIQVLSNAQFHLVVYTLFMLSKGFTTRQFFLIESAYYLVSLLMEIPTGVLSDTKSRKWSLVLASLVGLVTLPVIIVSNSFALVLIAMGLAGVSAALVSGTDEALLFDSLQALGRKSEFKKVTGQMSWASSLSMALAFIIGGLLADIDMTLAWWAYFGAGVLALVVKLMLQEPPLSGEQKEQSYRHHLGKSLKIAATGPAAYFVLYAATIWLFFSLGFWLWQPYLELSRVPIAWFGFIYAAQNVIGGYAAKQAHRIEGRLGIRTTLALVPLLLALALVLESQFLSVFGFAFIMIHAIASGCFHPLLSDYINQRIPSARRATVLSLKNMLNSMLFMTLSPLVGHCIDHHSLPQVLLPMGGIVTALSLVFATVYPKANTGAFILMENTQ